MSKPTNEQLNEAAARLCGWVDIAYLFKGGFNQDGTIRENRHICLMRPTDVGSRYDVIEPDGTETRIRQGNLPRYCTDRNALPELWEAVEKKERRARFITYLMLNSTANPKHHDSGAPYVKAWNAVTSTPKQQTEAALRALDAWPDDWSEE